MDKFRKIVNAVLSVTDFIIAWFNKTANGVVRRLKGLDPEFNDNIDDAINKFGQPQTDAEFIANVEKFVKGSPIQRFFNDKNKDFVKELAEKAAALRNDESTPLGKPHLIPKTIQVTMHQQVIYCDDSSSMKREGRWDSQKELANRIAVITTRILPKGEGVALRFINQGSNDSADLSLEQIGSTLDGATWSGDTPIATSLKQKILEPLVYTKLDMKALARPLLISIITDGMPEPEPRSLLVETILECGDKLQSAGYPRESVKFVIGHVGSAASAARFIGELANEQRIKDVAFIATERLDSQVSKLTESAEMDEWLITTLYSPFDNPDSKKRD